MSGETISGQRLVTGNARDGTRRLHPNVPVSRSCEAPRDKMRALQSIVDEVREEIGKIQRDHDFDRNIATGLVIARLTKASCLFFFDAIKAFGAVTNNRALETSAEAYLKLIDVVEFVAEGESASTLTNLDRAHKLIGGDKRWGGKSKTLDIALDKTKAGTKTVIEMAQGKAGRKQAKRTVRDGALSSVRMVIEADKEMGKTYFGEHKLGEVLDVVSAVFTTSDRFEDAFDGYLADRDEADQRKRDRLQTTRNTLKRLETLLQKAQRQLDGCMSAALRQPG